jgi:hypothetical protein
VSDVDPARAYKDVIAELTAAAGALRDRDRARAAELARDLVDLDEAMVRAADRADRSRQAVDLHWEHILETLEKEDGLLLKLPPRPDPDAEPDELDVLNTTSDRAAAAVIEAAERRSWFGMG